MINQDEMAKSHKILADAYVAINRSTNNWIITNTYFIHFMASKILPMLGAEGIKDACELMQEYATSEQSTFDEFKKHFAKFEKEFNK